MTACGDSTSTTLPPIVVISSPADGATFLLGSPIGFEGAANDPEDGELSGASLSWASDVDGALGTGIYVTRSDLSVGDHTIVLVATDRDGIADTASVGITVLENQTPSAVIADPRQGMSVVEGTAIDFRGSGDDPEDGTLPDSALVWTSDIQGQIGTGSSFARNDLLIRSHTVTLTVTDSHGASAAAVVAFSVAKNQAPSAWITGPEPGLNVLEGTSIDFHGSGNDPEDGMLFPDTALVWTSSLQGHIGTGPSFARDDLLPGSHNITLTVTDSHGAKDTAAVDLLIEDDVGDLFRSAFLELFGIDVPLPGWTTTQPLNVPSRTHQWTGTAYIESNLYRVYIEPDSTLSGGNLGTRALLPKGEQRVVVVAVDHGNTNIAEVLDDEWVMAQDSIDRHHERFAQTRGLAETLVRFQHTNLLAAASEISSPFNRDQVVEWLASQSITGDDYDIVVSLNLDADSLAGGFTNGTDFVFMGCYFCTDGGIIQLDLKQLVNVARAVYHHEVGHIWGWEHEWTPCCRSSAERWNFITVPTLFGWEDTDADGLPEIIDPTPYGRN